MAKITLTIDVDEKTLQLIDKIVEHSKQAYDKLSFFRVESRDQWMNKAISKANSDWRYKNMPMTDEDVNAWIENITRAYRPMQTFELEHEYRLLLEKLDGVLVTSEQAKKVSEAIRATALLRRQQSDDRPEWLKNILYTK
jgi:hypothetical protein